MVKGNDAMIADRGLGLQGMSECRSRGVALFRRLERAGVKIIWLGVVLSQPGCTNAQSNAIVFPSPSGDVSLVKQYGPGDLAEDVTLTLSRRGHIEGSSKLITTITNPSETINGEGATVSWLGDANLTIGWPIGAKPISGPSRLDGVKVSYTPYEPDLWRLAERDLRKLRLTQVSVGFRETDGHYGSAKYATGAPVEETKCVVQLTGADNIYLHRTVTVLLIGNGIGRANSGPAMSFGGASVVFLIAPPPKGSTPSLTRGKLGSVFSINDAMSAPDQALGQVSYRGLTANDAKEIFSAMRAGAPHVRVAFGFGSQAIDYTANVKVPDVVIDKFNACSAKTNIYGGGFKLSH